MADWYRFAGSLAIIISMTSDTPADSFGFTWSGGASSAFRCLCITLDGFFPSNGTFPVTMWYSVAPSE